MICYMYHIMTVKGLKIAKNPFGVCVVKYLILHRHLSSYHLTHKKK